MHSGCPCQSGVRACFHCQWEYQDPKIEVRHYIKEHLLGHSLLHSLYIGLIYGRYLQFR